MRVLLVVSEDWTDFDLVYNSVADLIIRNGATESASIEYVAECPKATLWSALMGGAWRYPVREATDHTQDLCVAFITLGDEHAEILASVADAADVPVVKFRLP